ncbi:MAG TPA: hypothetical protein DEP35_06045 [Deltaproteobacteria bacterium]|nr:hypothetical protein [Deltaproteobacteria bacterium]
MPHDRRSTAYHEAGHAVASFYLDVPGNLVFVTIEPPGNGLDLTHCQGSVDAKNPSKPRAGPRFDDPANGRTSGRREGNEPLLPR